jgi:hypothetical protein
MIATISRASAPQLINSVEGGPDNSTDWLVVAMMQTHVIHGDDVFWWDLELDVMHGI